MDKPSLRFACPYYLHRGSPVLMEMRGLAWTVELAIFEVIKIDLIIDVYRISYILDPKS